MRRYLIPVPGRQPETELHHIACDVVRLRLWLRRGRPWVALKPVCDAIGARCSRQVARLKARPGFELREIEGEICLSLFDLSGFLLTVRPRDEADAASVRSRWAAELGFAYLEIVSGHPSTASADRGKGRNLAVLAAADHARRRRSQVDSAMLAEIDRLIAEGCSQASIGRVLNLSRSTVCRLVNRRYPARAVSSEMSVTSKTPSGSRQNHKINAMQHAQGVPVVPAGPIAPGAPGAIPEKPAAAETEISADAHP